MTYDAQQLMKMSQPELDALFKASTAGNIPKGVGAGTAIIAPGTAYSAPIAEAINRFAWQGKVFDPDTGTLRNEILPMGINAVIAKVYKGPSWLDGKECIVLDYSETSLLAHYIRDEIRQIGPGFYFGPVYWSKTHIFNFCLQF